MFSKSFKISLISLVFLFSLMVVALIGGGTAYSSCQLPDECLFGCGDFCCIDDNCQEGYICYETPDHFRHCRNPDCPEQENCECPETSPTPTPPPDETPTPTPTPTSPPSDDGNGDDGGTGGPSEPSVCGSEKPPTPTLLSVNPFDSSANLNWTAVEPVTHYAIVYGLSSGDYLYGVDNTGNVTSYDVGSLDPAADYCFAVRAVNDCAPGDLSNEICTGEVLGAGQVLGATTLADTGSFADDLFRILFIISNVCLGLGLKLLHPVKKTA